MCPRCPALLLCSCEKTLTKGNLGREEFVWRIDRLTSLRKVKAGIQDRNLEVETKTDSVRMPLLACSLWFDLFAFSPNQTLNVQE